MNSQIETMAAVTRTQTLKQPHLVNNLRITSSPATTTTKPVTTGLQEISARKPSETIIASLRLLCVSALIVSYVKYNKLQEWTNQGWQFLCSTWVYNCVYFETWYTVACYAVLLAFPYVLTKTGLLQRYKINPDLKWQSAGMRKLFFETIEYVTPFMILDTLIVKRYCGVDPKEWDTRAQNYIQYTRALPRDPPTVFQIFYQLILSLVIYDLLFFLVHFTIHRNLWLYKYTHADHHEHSVVHSRLANQLSVPERIILVLSANQALKFVHAHPMTRTVFVPVFMSMLIEIHCGYDFPFTMDKILPFGIYGGSVPHYKHHNFGSRNYEPFFTHLDKLLDFYTKWKNGNKKAID